VPDNPVTRCVVPGCAHWTRRFAAGWEWVCGTHWRLVDSELKALRVRIGRKYGRQGRRYWRFENLVWRRMKRQAIERAVGIG